MILHLLLFEGRVSCFEADTDEGFDSGLDSLCSFCLSLWMILNVISGIMLVLSWVMEVIRCFADMDVDVNVDVDKGDEERGRSKNGGGGEVEYSVERREGAAFIDSTA